MPYYECVYLARQDIAASQVEALSDSFAETIASGGGEVKKREYWGLRNLAYRVKKNRKAHYVLMNIDAPAAAVHEMQRLMRLNADVLRELTLRVDELNEGPSIMMQRREERRDRGERRSRRDDERRAERAAAAERSAADKAPAEKAAAEKAADKKAEVAAEKPADKPADKPIEEKTQETVGEGFKPSPTDTGEAADKAPSESVAEEAPAEKAAEDSAGETAGEGLKPSPTEAGEAADEAAEAAAAEPAAHGAAEKTADSKGGDA